MAVNPFEPANGDYVSLIEKIQQAQLKKLCCKVYSEKTSYDDSIKLATSAIKSSDLIKNQKNAVNDYAKYNNKKEKSFFYKNNKNKSRSSKENITANTSFNFKTPNAHNLNKAPISQFKFALLLAFGSFSLLIFVFLCFLIFAYTINMQLFVFIVFALFVANMGLNNAFHEKQKKKAKQNLKNN